MSKRKPRPLMKAGWLTKPRDYRSLVANYWRIHSKPMPESLVVKIEQIEGGR